MRFRLGHPDYPAFDQFITTPNEDVRQEVERLGPLGIITSAYDWPRNEYPFHGWAEQLNRIVWPAGGDQFASCLLLLDDNQAALVKALTDLQFIAAGQPSSSSLSTLTSSLNDASGVLTNAEEGDTLSSLHTPDGSLTAALVNGSASALSAFAENFSVSSIGKLTNDFATTVTSISSLSLITDSPEAPRPYLILRAMLSPKEGALQAEIYTAAGMTPADVSDTDETELVAWKLYPLPPVRLPETDASDRFPGMWLLPLVDLRYFWRLGPVGSDRGEGSSSSGDATDPASSFPVSNVNPREAADWMPPLVTYPDDLDEPANFVPIIDNGTHPAIAAVDSRGWAADMQARMENWRVVCRDVRSDWNSLSEAHGQFTGILCDYPDDPEAAESYHLDAIRLAAVPGNLIDGGMTNTDEIRDLIPRKIRMLFRIVNQSSTYEVDVYPTEDDPQTVDELAIDTDGPSEAEKLHLPKTVLGVLCRQESPDDDTKNDLYTAAKQWVVLYYLWRRKQCYFKFPGIAPLMPNGYSSLITWDFSTDHFWTTYVANDYIEGTSEAGFGFGDSSASSSSDGESVDNTAFVLCVSDQTVEGRYPVIRMDQIGLPSEWVDREPAWGFNVYDSFGLVPDQLYLCHRNIDQYLALDQWATRDCCIADTSSESTPDNSNCQNGCCPNAMSTITLSIQALADCNPCLTQTITLHCNDRFGHWSGSSTCTSAGCTVFVAATLQCIPCSNQPAHNDCPVDCSKSPYYFCLNWLVKCSGACGSFTQTGHKSWPADEVTCNPFSLPGFRATICNCDTFWCIGICNFNRFYPCEFGLTGTFFGASGAVKVPLVIFGYINWCLFPNSDPLTCNDCFMVPNTNFLLVWDQVDQRWECTGFTAVGASGCTWNSLGITITPVDMGMGITSMNSSSVWTRTDNVGCHTITGMTTTNDTIKTATADVRAFFKCPCTRLPFASINLFGNTSPGSTSGECSIYSYVYC